MDALTHVLVGYTLGLIIFRDVRLAAATAAGALAPDLDVLLVPLSLLEPFYFLQHRGATHSLIGAPLSALGVVWLAGRIGRRWRRLAPLQWRPGTGWAAALGGWTHLPLDGITHHGVPWLWPFIETSQSPELYYWMIAWLAPFSFAVLLWRYRGRITDRAVHIATVGIVAAIVVMGGIRLAERPDEEHVFSQSNPYEWLVAHEHDNGTWRIDVVRDGAVDEVFWYEQNVAVDAAPALAALRETIAYRSFRMDGFGIEAVHATPVDGGWHFQLTDVVSHAETRLAPDWLPRERMEQRSLLCITVTDHVQAHREC